METLKLVNFLNHEESTFNWKPVNLVFGPNGGGKSSIVSAIEWALTGSCRDLDGRGVKNDELVRLGANAEMFVQLCSDQAPYAQRLYEAGNTELSVSGVNGRMAEVEAGLWRMVGLEKVEAKKTREVLRLFLRAGDLTRWTDKSWHEVLGMLSAGGMRDVLDDLARHLSSAGVPDVLRAVVQSTVVKAKDQTFAQVGTMQSRPHIVSALHKWFYGHRRDAKKLLAEAKVRAVPEPEDAELGALKDPDFASRAEVAKGRVGECRIEVDTNRSMVARLDEVARTEEIRAMRRVELKQRIEFLKGDISVQPGVEHIKEEERHVRACAVAERKLAKQLEALGAEDDNLAQAVTAVINRWGDQLSKKSVGVLTKVAGIVPGEAADDPAEVAKNLAEARKNLARCEDILEELRTLFAKGAKAVGELEVTKKDLAQMTASSEIKDGDLHREALALWEGRLLKAEKELEVIKREAHRRQIARTTVRDSTVHLEKEWRALDLLVKAMESPQVKTGGGGQLFQDISKTMLASVEALFGPEARLEIPDSGHFRLDGKSWETLSASEKLRFGCALTAGVSRMFNFPWLIIDGVELLVGKENRTRFFRWLQGQMPHFTKIIVLAASEDREGCPRFDRDGDWRTYWVEDGKAVILYPGADAGVP